MVPLERHSHWLAGQRQALSHIRRPQAQGSGVLTTGHSARVAAPWDQLAAHGVYISWFRRLSRSQDVVTALCSCQAGSNKATQCSNLDRQLDSPAAVSDTQHVSTLRPSGHAFKPTASMRVVQGPDGRAAERQVEEPCQVPACVHTRDTEPAALRQLAQKVSGTFALSSRQLYRHQRAVCLQPLAAKDRPGSGSCYTGCVCRQCSWT
jgi:hypothetical protein